MREKNGNKYKNLEYIKFSGLLSKGRFKYHKVFFKLVIKMADGKPKLGARLTRAAFVGNLVGALMFVVFYLTMMVICEIGGLTAIQPVYAGIIGWVTGMSASLGIELSKDLE